MNTAVRTLSAIQVKRRVDCAFASGARRQRSNPMHWSTEDYFWYVRGTSSIDHAIRIFHEVKEKIQLEDDAVGAFGKAEEIVIDLQHRLDKHADSGLRVQPAQPLSCLTRPWSYLDIYPDFILFEDPKATKGFQRHTCDPRQLDSSKSNRPECAHWATPVFFRPEVLERYRSDPGRYSLHRHPHPKDNELMGIGGWNQDLPW